MATSKRVTLSDDELDCVLTGLDLYSKTLVSQAQMANPREEKDVETYMPTIVKIAQKYLTTETLATRLRGAEPKT
jgi:hypothetical protein